MERHFRILDVEIELAGPRAIVEPIAGAYRRFERPHGASPPVRVEFVPASCSSGSRRPAVIRVDDRRFPVLPGVDPRLQLYNRFLGEVLDGIGSHAVLHAAALRRPGGGALLIAAPSGYGKTTLALELVARGWRLLSDDYAPLNLATGMVAPYPRAFAVETDTRSPLPSILREKVSRARAGELLGKRIVDPGDLFGESRLAPDPVPLAGVVLVEATRGALARDGQADVRLAAALRDARRIEQDLRAIPGVEIIQRRATPGLAHWGLRLDRELGPIEALSSLLEDDAVLFSEPLAGPAPDFDAAPQVETVGRRETASRLAAGMLNRRRRGRLLRRYDGSLTRLFLDLASALRGAVCRRLVVGRLQEAADLIEAVPTATALEGSVHVHPKQASNHASTTS